MSEAQIQAFFDEATKTVTYLVHDPASRRGVVIDPVLDYDAAAGKVGTHSVDEVLEAAREQQVTIEWTLETHVHADHLSGAPLIKAKTGAQIAIGEQVKQVQTIFRPIFQADDVKGDGSDFDLLLKDGDVIEVGEMRIHVMHVPGHTPADMAYRVGDAVFVGDTLFMPDYGTARADFPGGDARTLYRSIQKILSLPPETRLFMCHDYKAPGRDEYAWESSVAEQKATNRHVHEGVSEDEFVAMREARDATLSAPDLIMPSIQVNMRAGRLPPAEANGVRYLKIPLKFEEEGDEAVLGA
ncbi:MBL fold metallo-hydrolase [Sphingomicrobium lutaoense]|uniref:Glyoxylase-like metal-dependent hydrolase (Beta-lactamase superfamily II) n=1 Tax=Sphingomicrobium lutaoense TaxID=515949 RepID=A0A839Z0H1_9SPHN|nr:MBL fold metallo-hydrolase [Sphingomicrobium lutaoense]MBB3764766.1 glyoxylase-like metal-dependent hydrolase (beta-lactamase superfamily II) [Sphingomicrobium lutaoense]